MCCSFHWGQAVWRRLQQDMGLQSAYNTDDAMHRYCRQLLALPCLPAELIPDVFDELAAEATTDVQRLCTYVRKTWVQSAVWPPSTWSVFNRAVWSNNDVEGWYRQLNAKSSCGSLNLYLLMQMLASESQLVNIQLSLPSPSLKNRTVSGANVLPAARRLRGCLSCGTGWRASSALLDRQILRAASHIFPMWLCTIDFTLESCGLGDCYEVK